MYGKDRFNTLSLTQFFENGENAVTNYLMVIQSVCLSDYHIREITPQSIAPKIADVFRTFGIMRNISPVIGYFHSKISRATVDCKPSDTGFGVFAIFYEMIATAECAETFVEDAFL